MTNATISISKVYTVSTEASIYNINSSDLATELEKFDTVIIKGWFGLNKFNKIVKLLNEKNFNETNCLYKNITEKDNSIDFRIEFTKN